MAEKTEWSVAALFERAKNDEQWEPDADRRNKLTNGLLRSLLNSLS